jgi:hypothetical protein
LKKHLTTLLNVSILTPRYCSGAYYPEQHDLSLSHLYANEEMRGGSVCLRVSGNDVARKLTGEWLIGELHEQQPN